MSLLIPRADFAVRALPVVLALALSACASTATHLGRDAEYNQDYDRAVVEYTKALRQKPDDADARIGLERSRSGVGESSAARPPPGGTGKLDEALVECSMAAG
jgi:Flp pilus assembly protein TadD